MKNKQELLNEISALQAEMDKLKTELEAPKSMIERAEDGGSYFYIDYSFTVSRGDETNNPVDKCLFDMANYYLLQEIELAEKVAKYYRDNNWFIRKAIEFADGYEFVDGNNNYYVYVNKVTGSYGVNWSIGVFNPVNTYMTKENAEKFKEWLEEYKPLR